LITLPCSGHRRHRIDRPHALVPGVLHALHPGSFLNVATIVHSDEALLATASSLPCISSNTHFAAGKIPHGLSRYSTGRMPLEELKRDKPREYEALVAAGKADENMGRGVSANRDPHHSRLRLGGSGLGFSITLWIILCRLIRLPIELICASMHRRTYKCSRFVLLYFPWLLTLAFTSGVAAPAADKAPIKVKTRSVSPAMARRE